MKASEQKMSAADAVYRGLAATVGGSALGGLLERYVQAIGNEGIECAKARLVLSNKEVEG